MVKTDVKQVGIRDKVAGAVQRFKVDTRPGTLTASTEIVKLKSENPTAFDYHVAKLQGATPSEAIKTAYADNNKIAPALPAQSANQLEKSKKYQMFSTKFYEAMASNGYKKADPERLALYYERLQNIALSDVMEPRDNINALKLLLQYNDMNIAEMTKAKELNTGTRNGELLSETIKTLRASLKIMASPQKTITIQ